MTTKLRAASFQDGAVTNAKLAGSIATAKLVQGSSFLTSLPTGSVLQVVGTVNATNLSQSGDTSNMEAAVSQAITRSSWSIICAVLPKSLIFSLRSMIVASSKQASASSEAEPDWIE